MTITIFTSFDYTDDSGVKHTVTLTAGSGPGQGLSDLVYTLAEPVDLGTPEGALHWVGKTFNITDLATLDVSKPIPGLPDEFQKQWEALMDGHFILQSLIIDRPSHHYKVGFLFDMSKQPFPLVGSLELDQIGLVYESEAPSAQLTQDDSVQASAVTTTLAVDDITPFKANCTVEVNKNQWLVTAAPSPQGSPVDNKQPGTLALGTPVTPLTATTTYTKGIKVFMIKEAPSA